MYTFSLWNLWFWPMILTYDLTYDFDLWFWPMSWTYDLTYDENHRSPMIWNHRSPMIHATDPSLMIHATDPSLINCVFKCNRSFNSKMLSESSYDIDRFWIIYFLLSLTMVIHYHHQSYHFQNTITICHRLIVLHFYVNEYNWRRTTPDANVF